MEKKEKKTGPLEQIGCIVMSLIVCVPATLIGVSLLKGASQQSRDSALVAAMKPSSAGEVAAAAAGARVLAVGRIAASTPVVEPERKLVIYVRETCSKKYGRKGKVSYTWQETSWQRPDFELTAPSGPMPILGRSYALRRATLDEEQVNRVCVAWHGFQAGDAVVVDGRVVRGVLKADVVFGGDQAAYAAYLAAESSTERTWAAGLFGLAAVIAIGAVLYIRHCRRRQAGAAAAARA
jgi:hypothetical protein